MAAMKLNANKEVHMETGDISKTLLAFALPVLLSQLLQELYNIADCIIVGQFAGPTALAATGIAGLVVSVVVNFFIGFSSGISAITAKHFGARDYKLLRVTIYTITVLSIAAGVVITLVGRFSSGAILHLLNSPKNTYPMALIYLNICFFGIIPQLIYNVGTAVLRSLGDTVSPLRLFLYSALLNIVLDLLFVASLHMGIAGAATATLISQWLLSVFILRRMFKMDDAYRLHVRDKMLSLRQILQILWIGLPCGFQALFMSASSLLIQISINRFGSAAVAGMTVFAKVEGFLYYPAFAYGIALTSFVGQNLGANRIDRVKDSIRISLKTVLIFMIPLSLGLILLAPLLLRCFTSDAAVLANGYQAVRWIFPFYILYAVNQVYLGAMKGLGSTFYPMISTFVCYFVFRIIWTYKMVPVLHSMIAVYTSYDVSWIIMILMLIPRFHACLRKIEQGGMTLESIL